MVVEYFGTWAARAGVAHGPEVVTFEFRTTRLVPDADHTIFRNSDFPGPNAISLVIGLVNRNPQALWLQAINLRQQLPGITNGVLLEIVTETEVAQHFEKSVVPGSVPNLVEVVVFSPRAYAALRAYCSCVCPLFSTQEHVFELHHPGISEQQRRIIGRHERT